MVIRPESECRDVVRVVQAEHRSRIGGRLPQAKIEHIGATSVEGSLTKGDLDLLVRVPGIGFEEAVVALGGLYAIHQRENWTPTFASFKAEPDPQVPLGVQLVAAGSTDDRAFMEWRERLSTDPDLLRRYNDLKLAHADDDPEDYVDAKAKFIEENIGTGLGSG